MLTCDIFLCHGVNDDYLLPEAIEALVNIAFSLDSSWKFLVGYFLADGILGQFKAYLSKECISRLYDVVVRVIS